MLYTFNHGLISNCFPYEWKMARLVPIHKKGPRNLTENYRPISILPAWWSEIKRLGGMKSMNSSLINLINIAGLEDISEQELANRINTAFLSLYQNINYLHR